MILITSSTLGKPVLCPVSALTITINDFIARLTLIFLYVLPAVVQQGTTDFLLCLLMRHAMV